MAKGTAKGAAFVLELDAWEKKYFDLVWYARTSPDDPVSQPGRRRVEAAWSADLEELRSDDSNWQHGFNSGCLAAFRLVQGLLGSPDDADVARETFPFLDT
jgi:hypothetical protein